MGSGESGEMQLCGATGGVGEDTERWLEESLCNSPNQEAQTNKGRCRRGGRTPHWRVEIQAQAQRELQT